MINNNINKKNYNISRLKLILVIILTTIIIYLLISLFSFNINDPGWSSISSKTIIKNYAGKFGAYIASFILSIFGIIGFILPFLLIGIIRNILIRKNNKTFNYFLLIIKVFGIIVIIISSCELTELYFNSIYYLLPQSSGGIIGYEGIKFNNKYLGSVGGNFILIMILFIGITLYSGAKWLYFLRTIMMLLYNIIYYIITIIYNTKCIFTNKFKKLKKK